MARRNGYTARHMRVTGGVLRGRRVVVPGHGVRPTQDRVRAAMFCSLASRIPGCRFLDLFAGSGAVGLEAWSRGAGDVWWVERDPGIYAVLRKNVELLCRPDQGADGTARAVLGDVFKWTKNAGVGSFDLIFADPPYDRDPDSAPARCVPEAIREAGLLARGGLLVVEEPAGRGDWETPSWRVVRDRDYGMSRLVFLEPAGAAGEEDAR